MENIARCVQFVENSVKLLKDREKSENEETEKEDQKLL